MRAVAGAGCFRGTGEESRQKVVMHLYPGEHFTAFCLLEGQPRRKLSCFNHHRDTQNGFGGLEEVESQRDYGLIELTTR